MIPIILHIPHSSREIPPDIRPQFLLTDNGLSNELLLMTDAHTDDLFSLNLPEVYVIAYPVSRLVVDPERFLDDAQEVMSRKGMGAIYRLTADGRTLRKELTIDEKNSLIEKYYHPHHKKFEASVSAQIKQHRRCLIIDCHSFPELPLPYEDDQVLDRPDICIGTDEFHTPSWLVDRCVGIFEVRGYSVKTNTPFSGSIVPTKFYQQDKRVMSIMIEVNRKLYMNEADGSRNVSYKATKSYLLEIMEDIQRYVSDNNSSS